jgi:hypothetical protein
LEIHDHPSPYPFGWVHKDAYIKVTKLLVVEPDYLPDS